MQRKHIVNGEVQGYRQKWNGNMQRGGPDGLNYPWGNVFDNSRVRGTQRLNTGEYKTADVGSYVTGMSWVGAMDMAGNVREWTNSTYQGYPHTLSLTQTIADPLMVLRGGSFGHSAGGLRTASRSWNLAGKTDDSIGFRCVR
ncbi:MAG: SUMF1/EgtB/PvdO family nonheme iron enzyme [Deinococcales bacterium]